MNSKTDGDLVAISAGHLFKPSITSIAFRRGTFLRGYMYRFVNLFAPHLSQKVIGAFYGKPRPGRGEKDLRIDRNSDFNEANPSITS